MVERLLAQAMPRYSFRLRLSAARRMSAAADRVFALLGSDSRFVPPPYGRFLMSTSRSHMDRLAGPLDAAE